MYIEWSATHSVSFLRAKYLKMMGKTAAELVSEKRVLKFGRKKRQIWIVAVGVSVLKGYILGNQWGYVKRQLGIEDGTVPEGVVEAINDDDQHFNVLGRHLVSLEKASYELRNQVMSQQHDEKMLVTLEQVILRRDDMLGHCQLIYDDIETLVTSRRLSTSLSIPMRVYD